MSCLNIIKEIEIWQLHDEAVLQCYEFGLFTLISSLVRTRHGKLVNIWVVNTGLIHSHKKYIYICNYNGEVKLETDLLSAFLSASRSSTVFSFYNTIHQNRKHTKKIKKLHTKDSLTKEVITSFLLTNMLPCSIAKLPLRFSTDFNRLNQKTNRGRVDIKISCHSNDIRGQHTLF